MTLHDSSARPALLSALLVTALLLSGCAATSQQASEAPNSAPESESGSERESAGEKVPAGHATVSVDGREFSFQLSRCLVYDESETELAGPGAETGSSTPSFFDGGAMNLGPDVLGEFRIDIGSDGPFQSSDEFISLGAPAGGGGFSIIKTGDDYLATGKSWDNNGMDLGTGTVQFSCS